MSTALASTLTRANNPERPRHPVDAALWGLAERLAASHEAATEPQEAPEAEPVSRPGVGQEPRVRVVGLPQRAGALPSVGRLSQRTRFDGVRSHGVPTKPAGASEAATNRVPKAPAEPAPAKGEDVDAARRRVQFTILKGRRNEALDGSDHVGGETRTGGQDFRPNGESSETPSPLRRRKRRRRAGVTIGGWLLLTAVAAVAAAIALFAPAWF